MGLDMYLYKKVYIGANYEHRKITGTIEIFEDGEPIKVNFNRVSEIVERVGYWRKANHIHQWFVRNVQNNVDDCGEYYVSTEKLIELLDICKEIKKHPKKAEELLPTQSGFFFGSTNYDQYYMQDIEDTIEILTPIVEEYNNKDYSDYCYHSSW